MNLGENKMSRTLHIVAVAATLLAALLISDAWRISRRIMNDE